MMRNTKTVAGLIGLAILLGGLIAMIVLLVPTIGQVQTEMSLTPTPLPAVPSSVMAVTKDPAAPTAEPVLRTGSRGQEVKDLQSRLQSLGYYQGEIDGEFGPGTKEAVTAFQKANGLDPDGRVGQETRSVLFSPQAKPNSGN